MNDGKSRKCNVKESLKRQIIKESSQKMKNSLDQRLGQVTLEPQTPVVAGTYGSCTLTYTVGTLGIDSNGQIKIAMRVVSDWAAPQFDEPQAEGYSTAVTDGAAKLRVGGRYANLLNYFDQELITLVELMSCWGVFEWMLIVERYPAEVSTLSLSLSQSITPPASHLT